MTPYLRRKAVIFFWGFLWETLFLLSVDIVHFYHNWVFNLGANLSSILNTQSRPYYKGKKKPNPSFFPP